MARPAGSWKIRKPGNGEVTERCRAERGGRKRRRIGGGGQEEEERETKVGCEKGGEEVTWKGGRKLMWRER